MFNHILVRTIGLLAFVSSSCVNATEITINKLTSNDDGSTDVIVDTLNNREWLRFDVLDHLTYQQTVDAIITGAYIGWEIADHNDAAAFLTAAGATGGCIDASSPGHFTGCAPTDINNYWIALTGVNNSQADEAWAWFLANPNSLFETGFINVFMIDADIAWSSGYDITGTDAWAGGTASANNDIGWLLYREVPVPEPATLALMGLGLAGIGYRRKKASSLTTGS